MAQLFLLNNTLSDLLATDTGVVEVSQTAPLEMRDLTTHQQGFSAPPHPDRNHPDSHPTTPTTGIPTHSLHMNRDIHALPPLPLDRDAHANPSTENRDIQTFPSPMGRDSDMPARSQHPPCHSQWVLVVLPLVG